MRKPGLDTIANFMVVVVGIAALGLAGARLFGLDGSPRSPPRAYSPGEQIPDGLIDLSKTQRTLVAVLDPDCRFCSAVLPALQEASRSVDGRTQFVVVGKRPKAELDAYVASAGGFASQVLSLPADALRVRGVPTLILVDKGGVVQQTWTGALNETSLKDLKAALGIAVASAVASAQ